MSLERTMRSLTIMGRSSEKEKIDLGQLFYPPMQAVDIHTLDLDIVHAGMDQRKIHMLVREIFPKMKWKVPVAVHHHILAGLGEPETSTDSDLVSSKMSKSKSASGIFVHDSDEEINSKFKKAWCPEGIVDKNPVLEISKHIVFHEFNEITVERPDKFGGNATYTNYQDLENDFLQKKLHPSDLKSTISKYVTDIIRPIREKITLTPELAEAIKKTT
jgi:tyrosyl-tRNA synthetase